MRLLRPPRIEVDALDDGAVVRLMRGHRLSDAVRLGPNEVHFSIVHPDGDYEDLGVSYNLLTTVGRDLLAAGLGNPTGKDGVFTASSSTSGTPAGGGMTADQYKGWRVFADATSTTTAPVYGNIGTNSTTVLTVDGWWVGTSDTMTGTTPGATFGYHIQPSCQARFMGVTADTGAASAGSTTLTAEITTNGLNRTKATYAHTPAAATYTLSVSYSVSGGPQTVHRGGLFTAANTTAGGVLVFETVANADAIVTTSDTLNATWTVTLSG
ncbi:MAG TPA: hypothetical protein VNN79_18300 [Actinomycetota bacterium]|nr:hypothetical protein [Actinomycetota bacterium]